MNSTQSRKMGRICWTSFLNAFVDICLQIFLWNFYHLWIKLLSTQVWFIGYLICYLEVRGQRNKRPLWTEVFWSIFIYCAHFYFQDMLLNFFDNQQNVYFSDKTWYFQVVCHYTKILSSVWKSGNVYCENHNYCNFLVWNDPLHKCENTPHCKDEMGWWCILLPRKSYSIIYAGIALQLVAN